MGIQVISRDGQPEYAVVPWEQYQALLQAGRLEQVDAAGAIAVSGGRAQLKFALPRQGVSLIVLDLAR